MTLEHGLMRTWRLPLFSALLMLLRASARTFMRTIAAARKDGGKNIIYFLTYSTLSSTSWECSKNVLNELGLLSCHIKQNTLSKFKTFIDKAQFCVLLLINLVTLDHIDFFPLRQNSFWTGSHRSLLGSSCYLLRLSCPKWLLFLHRWNSWKRCGRVTLSTWSLQCGAWTSLLRL